MYLIRKDGLWLMGFGATGVREFVGGKLKDVYTCVWGDDARAAKAYEHRLQANSHADLFGGEVVPAAARQEGGRE